MDDIKSEIFWPSNYHCYHHVAIKKGYSGVAIFTKQKPNNVIEGLGQEEFDAEGRYIECEFDDFSLASVYFPSGSSGEQRTRNFAGLMRWLFWPFRMVWLFLRI